jgi:hypothetical protein
VSECRFMPIEQFVGYIMVWTGTFRWVNDDVCFAH